MKMPLHQTQVGYDGHTNYRVLINYKIETFT